MRLMPLTQGFTSTTELASGRYAPPIPRKGGGLRPYFSIL